MSVVLFGLECLGCFGGFFEIGFIKNFHKKHSFITPELEIFYKILQIFSEIKAGFFRKNFFSMDIFRSLY